MLLLTMLLTSGPVLACTSANMASATARDDTDMGHASVVKMSSAAHMDPRVSMAPGEGLKLRTRQQDTLLSAALTERASPRPLPTPPAQAAPDTSAEHAYKPVAMLVAALALMLSIALRRTGKR